jgi:hypothetical protein
LLVEWGEVVAPGSNELHGSIGQGLLPEASQKFGDGTALDLALAQQPQPKRVAARGQLIDHDEEHAEGFG